MIKLPTRGKIKGLCDSFNNDEKVTLNDIMHYYIKLDNESQWRTFIYKRLYVFIENDINHTEWKDRTVQLDNIPPKATLERMSILYGTNGIGKWENYREIQKHTNSKEYKNMSTEEFNTYNKSRSVTKDNLIKRHGLKIGTYKWENYCKRQGYTNTLEYFIEKYGIKDGTEKYNSVNKSKAHNLENYINRYGDKGAEKFKQFCEKFHTGNKSYSNISQELFDSIIDDIEIEYNIYYATRNKEFGKYNTDLGKYHMYDFVIPELKICIEFNGDVYHANPEMFTENDTPNPHMKMLTSKEIWEFDKKKNNFIKNLGYDVIIVWERDYLNDKQQTVDKLVSYIKDNYVNYR